MRILLLSAYDAHSHRRWREGLVVAFPDWDWTVLTLPPRYFNWRIRGNSLSWAFTERARLERPYDLLIATSMTDLATLKGLAVLEAVASGCIPLAPNRLAYPEWLGPECQYPSSPAEPERESEAIARRLAVLARQYDRGALAPAPDISGLSWSHLRPAYATEIGGLARNQ